MYKNIFIESADNICTISINREAKLNALNIATLAEIKDAIERGNQDRMYMHSYLQEKGKRPLLQELILVNLLIFQ